MAVLSMAGEAVAPVGLMGRPVYELRGVSKTFAKRNVQALDKVDLTLREGTFSSIIGAERLRKVDPAQDHGRAAAALVRAASFWPASR